MSNIIDSIQLSGVTYTLSAQTSGGGVTTGEVQTMIDESISGKVDTSAITTSITSSSTDTQVPSTKAVYKVYTGCVTTYTDQNITGTKTFTGEKKILFKQQASTNKLGFTLQNSASTNNELGTFEFRPNTFTIDGVQHPLLYLGHYRNSMVANEGVPQTVVGFRQYDQKNTAAYHYLIPLPEKAKTPFSLTTSYKDYYAPIGFKIDNSTMVTTDNTGVVDLSSYVGGIDSGTVQTMIDESISGKTNQSDFTGHTADTTIHVTAQDKTNWNAKSDFSGSYNDLTDKPTIPTVPTSNTAFTNDAGYITDSALDGYATESYVTNGLDGKQDTLESGVNIKTINNYSILGSGNINIGGSGSNNVVELTQAEYDALDPKDPSAFYIITDAEGGDLANYMTSAQTLTAITQATSGKVDSSDVQALSGTVTAHTADTTVHVTAQDKTNWNAKSDFSGDYNDLTNKLSAGTNITIVDNVISASGGGKAIEAGRGITVTTGTTADTVSLNLAIESGTGTNSIQEGDGTTASGDYSHAEGSYTEASGDSAHAEGYQTLAGGNYSHAEGGDSTASGNRSHAEGSNTTAGGVASHAEGIGTEANNGGEHASGKYNVSHTGSTEADKTLFSVGNGTYDDDRHNAFEIRQNGDIYITSSGTDIKLQDHLGGGGGGSSYTAGTGIDITNDVISVTGMTAESAFTAHTADTTIHVTSADKTSWNGAATNASNAVTALGGLSLVKLTQTQYDNLSTKDSNTLYVIVN